MFLLLFIVSIILIGVLAYYLLSRSDRPVLPAGVRLAPLEIGWPIFGIVFSIEGPLCIYLSKLGRKHGALFRIKLGMRDVHIVNDYATLSKCFKDDGDNFSGRWNGKLSEIMDKQCGIIFIDGEVWTTQRAFMIRVLRDLGRSLTADNVQEKCGDLIAELASAKGESIDFSELMPIYTANIISKFVMNTLYRRHDQRYKCIGQISENLMKKPDKLQMFHLFFPFWDNNAWLSNLSYFVSFKRNIFENVYAVFREEIDYHVSSLGLNTEGQDLMDKFLMEKAHLEQTESAVGTFTEFQLIKAALELFVAGYETMSMTLVWSLLFLSKHPEIQNQMHEEIVNLIGSDQMPSMHDKRSLPLCQAIMDEIMRLSSVVPMSIFHRNFKDAVIDGIFIPANSLIIPNLYACHRDPHVWEKPLEFYPEHFLVNTDDGGLKYNPRDELVPFSIGKRQCLGESLARTEYFIFLISIIQRFKVRFANDVSEMEYQKAVIANDGGVRFSLIKDFVFEIYE